MEGSSLAQTPTRQRRQSRIGTNKRLKKLARRQKQNLEVPHRHWQTQSCNSRLLLLRSMGTLRPHRPRRPPLFRNHLFARCGIKCFSRAWDLVHRDSQRREALWRSTVCLARVGIRRRLARFALECMISIRGIRRRIQRNTNMFQMEDYGCASFA